MSLLLTPILLSLLFIYAAGVLGLAPTLSMASNSDSNLYYKKTDPRIYGFEWGKWNGLGSTRDAGGTCGSYTLRLKAHIL